MFLNLPSGSSRLDPLERPPDRSAIYYMKPEGKTAKAPARAAKRREPRSAREAPSIAASHRRPGLDTAIRHHRPPCPADEQERFDAYLEQLLLSNRTHRLTGLHGPARHRPEVLHRLACCTCPCCRGARPLRVADIGSGPGYPGVLRPIVDPRISLTLLDSSGRAMSFLCELKRSLRLDDVNVHQARAETYLAERPEEKGGGVGASYPAVALDGIEVASLREYLSEEGGLIIAVGPSGGT